ncbi:AAA family ATPase [Gottfriedia acidiceleris]|uniref:AAA family ATPase n=1 Tax=Gottfriedia acidiceleris TaxID=371036 RepID=UPI00101C1508|nr:AAA family ATPase [Gottfriedia acidiceleris]
MHIAYIWVKTYRKSIREQGFNFSDRFRIDYNYKEKVLTINNNPNFIENFFTTEMTIGKELTSIIKQFSAIVGENGVGKTSVLDLIKENLSIKYDRYNNKSFSIKDELIIVFTNPSNNKLYIYNHENIKIQKIKAPLELCYFQYHFQDSSPNLSNTQIIHFSNIFDNKKLGSEENNIIDISTNYLVRNDKGDKLSSNKSEVYIHNVYETIRKISFLSNKRNEPITTLPFKVPKTLYIVFNNIDIHDDQVDFSDQVISFLKKIDNKLNQKIEDRVIYNFLCHFFIEHGSLEPYQSSLINDFSKLKIQNGPNKYNNIFKWLIDALKNRSFDNKELFLSMAKNLKDMFDIIKGLLEEKRLKPFKENSLETLEIEIIKGDSKLERFFKIYQEVVYTNDFIELDWQDMSSGETAFFNLYSRFNYAFSLMEHRKKVNDIIILVDEGEVYLHPQWQKRFLDEFINLISYLFNDIENKYNIQVIMTSNSPFVVSDLPKSNITFLKRNYLNESSILVEKIEDHQQTFASNIHNLLANSFFMQDGLIGEFAKRKINEVVDILIGEDYDPTIVKNSDIIKRTIDIIGDPIIKTKLLNMLQEKIQLDFINIRKVLDDFQDQIDDLVKSNDLNRGKNK